MVHRGVEPTGRRSVERDMEMDPPFGRRGGIIGSGVLPFAGKCVVQVQVLHPGTVGPADDHLVQVNVIGERSQGAPGLRGGSNLERGTKMDFAEFYPMLNELANGVARLFELDRKVTSVVIDAQMLGQ